MWITGQIKLRTTKKSVNLLLRRTPQLRDQLVSTLSGVKVSRNFRS